MSTIELKDVIPILDVRNVDEALRYYVQDLGFQLDFRSEDGPDNYAGVRRGNVRLHMQWQHEDHFTNGTAGRLRVRIVVDNPDALFEEYRAKGVLDERTRVRDTEWVW